MMTHMASLGRKHGVSPQIFRTILFESGLPYEIDSGRIYVADDVRELIEDSWLNKHLPKVAYRTPRIPRATGSTAA